MISLDLPPQPKLWAPPKPAIIRAASAVPRADLDRLFDRDLLVRQQQERLTRGLTVSTFAASAARAFRAPAGGVGNDSFTKLLLHCDGADASTTFTDVSVGGAHGTATAGGNAQVDTAQSVFGGGSLLLDGSGDYLEYANHADWNLGGAGGGNDFTIDLRARLAAVDGTQRGFVATFNSGTNAGWYFYVTSSAIGVWTGAGTDRNVAWSPATDTWYHVALVRNGTTITIGVDGASLGTVADGDFNNDSQPIRIGIRQIDTTGQELNAHLDEIRITKGLARWTSFPFTPPTAAYG